MTVSDSARQEHWWRSASPQRLLVVVNAHAARPSDLPLLEICLCSVYSHHPHALTFLFDNGSPRAFAAQISGLARLAPRRILHARRSASGFAFGALSAAVSWALEHGAHSLAYLQHTMSLVRPLALPSTQPPCALRPFYYYERRKACGVSGIPGGNGQFCAWSERHAQRLGFDDAAWSRGGAIAHHGFVATRRALLGFNRSRLFQTTPTPRKYDDQGSERLLAAAAMSILRLSHEEQLGACALESGRGNEAHRSVNMSAPAQHVVKISEVRGSFVRCHVRLDQCPTRTAIDRLVVQAAQRHAASSATSVMATGYRPPSTGYPTQCRTLQQWLHALEWPPSTPAAKSPSACPARRGAWSSSAPPAGCVLVVQIPESMRASAGMLRDGMPIRYPHVLRDWLPLLWRCADCNAECSRVYVPPDDGYLAHTESIYRPLISAFAARLSITQTGRLDSNIVQCSPEGAISAADWRGFRKRETPTGFACNGSDVVFYTRPSGDQRRTVLNPSEAFAAVRAAAAQYNLTTRWVTFETQSMSMQRLLMCNAQLLVGQHGGGIGNILFSHAPHRAVIELPPWSRTWWQAILEANRVTHLFSGDGHTTTTSKARVAQRAGDRWHDRAQSIATEEEEERRMVRGVPYGELRVDPPSLKQTVEWALSGLALRRLNGRK